MSNLDEEDAKKDIYSNQVIKQKILTGDLYTGLSIGTFQAGFQLDEADFLRLKSKGTPLDGLAMNFFFATVGYGMSILPKFFSELAGKAEKVTSFEWSVLGVGVVISLTLCVVGRFVSNERKKLLNRIEEHFKSAPKTHQFFREEK